MSNNHESRDRTAYVPRPRRKSHAAHRACALRSQGLLGASPQPPRRSSPTRRVPASASLWRRDYGREYARRTAYFAEVERETWNAALLAEARGDKKVMTAPANPYLGRPPVPPRRSTPPPPPPRAPSPPPRPSTPPPPPVLPPRPPMICFLCKLRLVTHPQYVCDPCEEAHQKKLIALEKKDEDDMAAGRAVGYKGSDPRAARLMADAAARAQAELASAPPPPPVSKCSLCTKRKGWGMTPCPKHTGAW